MASQSPIAGGCLCGAIRYAATGAPFHATLCTCTLCTRSTGAPIVGWVSFPRAGFAFTRGKPRRYASSATAERSFCPTCGTSLTFEARALPDEVDVTLASLDDPQALPPRDHLYTITRVRWLKISDGLPQFPGAREQEPPD